MPTAIAAQPDIAGSAAPNASGMPVRLQVIAIGTWSVSGGSLAISLRTLRPWPGPLPMPLPYATADATTQ
ncbi:MAG: hypothetical protein EXR67_05610 [Dehalococcoidia bacterium]|nr:hypothetical protein [Dehalococcoidia bacterium]